MHLICCKILRRGKPVPPLNCPHRTVAWEGKKSHKTRRQLMKMQGEERGQGTKVSDLSDLGKSQVQIRDFIAQGLHYSLGTRDTWALCPFHQAEVEPTSPSSPTSPLTTQPSRGSSSYQPPCSCYCSPQGFTGLQDEEWKWCSHHEGGHRSCLQSQEKTLQQSGVTALAVELLSKKAASIQSLLREKRGGTGNLRNIQQKKRVGWQSGLWASKLTAEHNMDLDGSGGRTRSWWLRGTWLTDVQMAQEFRLSEGEEERAREFWGLVLVMG